MIRMAFTGLAGRGIGDGDERNVAGSGRVAGGEILAL